MPAGTCHYCLPSTRLLEENKSNRSDKSYRSDKSKDNERPAGEIVYLWDVILMNMEGGAGSIRFGNLADGAGFFGVIALGARQVPGKELGRDDAHNGGEPFGDIDR
jgi:hypothetical protein